MSLPRFLSALSVVVLATGSLVAAAPNNDGKKAPAPVAPAKDEGSAAPAAGDGGGSGSAVQMTEDEPPADMNGTDENPDAPRDIMATTVTKAAPAPAHPSGYPIEETLRPITLPANMSEVSIGPHMMVSPVSTSDALRARYGITSRVQLGLTYVWGGFFETPGASSMSTSFHPGKAVGVDVTVLLQNWLAVRVGVPVYIDPVAVGLQLGAPMKFQVSDKIAFGGLDDLLLIKISKFAPSFNYEQENAVNAYFQTNNTETSSGHLRFSGYVVYNHTPKLAIIGRGGIDSDLGAGGGSSAGTQSTSATAPFLRGGIQYTPRKYLDLGASLGFEDLAHGGTFSPAGYLAVRI